MLTVPLGDFASTMMVFFLLYGFTLYLAYHVGKGNL